MRKGIRIKSMASTGIMLLIMLALATPSIFAAPATELIASNATKISRVTGATPAGETLPNPTPTTAYGLYATDL